jgi:hypothetical protein
MYNKNTHQILAPGKEFTCGIYSENRGDTKVENTPGHGKIDN